MPNRMLRPWINSDKVNSLSVHSERFFTRLIMIVDDYGCFYADTRLLRANLFPLLLDSVRDADISRWMAECQKAGLIVIYENESKKYLRIIDFKQRLDRAKNKFPLPDNELPESVNDFPPEVEVEVEREVEKEKRGVFRPPEKDEVVKEFSLKLDDFSAMGNADKFMAFYESKGWLVGKTKMKDWRAAVRGWVSRMGDFGDKPAKQKQNLEKLLAERGDEKV